MKNLFRNHKLLVLSLALNACIIAGASVFLAKNPRFLKKHVMPYFRSAKVPGNYAAKLDTTQFTAREERVNALNSNKEIRVLVLGNSVSLHDIVPGVWARESGMAASDRSKDYVHLLMKKIAEEKNVNVVFEVVNVADFETSFNSFDIKRLSLLRSHNPDFVIFQIGENIRSDEFVAVSGQFKKHYVSLVNYFEDSKRIVCLPFVADMNKSYVITDVGIQTKSYVVDLSHLGCGLDKRNHPTTENTYDHPGVADHPGDFGMVNIANVLFSVFNVTL